MEKARLIKVEDSRLVLTKTWSNEDRAPIITWLGLLFAGSDSTEKLRNAQIASETFLLKQIQGIVHRDYSGIDGQPVEPSEIECPHCSEKVIIDGDGEYTCPWCKEDVTVEDGEPFEPYEIECPHCGEEVVIEGNGEFSCPECGEDFVVG
jgi:DNA-directed RNA polymerase subunit RPC12/RpoP